MHSVNGTAEAAHIDFETGSPVNLKEVGVTVYALHPLTRVFLFSWRIGNTGPKFRWHPGDPAPVALLNWIAAGKRVVAHNAAFELALWNLCLRIKYERTWPELTIAQTSCTMARALALALPGGLEDLARVLSLHVQKDMEGAALMRKMMKPYKPRKNEPRPPDADGLHWHDTPENIARLGDYCDVDVETETAVDCVVPELSARERRIWEWDQKVNRRGIGIDTAYAAALLDIVGVALARCDALMVKITGGAVAKCSQVSKLKSWIQGLGVTCLSIAKGEVEDLIVDTRGSVHGAKIEAALRLRREAAKASTSKLGRMLGCAGEGGRARDQFQYHGAAPGRWAGRLIQVQNLPRVDEDDDAPGVFYVLKVLAALLPAEDAHDLIEMAWGPVMPLVSKCMRAMLQARRGTHYVGADLSNIEGRYNAWLWGEQWKLDAFRAYDRGEGPDLYKVTAAGLTGKTPDQVTKPERQAQGKVPELAFGYQGSIGAYLTMGSNAGVKPASVVPIVYATTAPETWSRTAALYDGAKRFGLTRDEWTAIKVVVGGWRSKHPGIVQGWWDLGDAAVEAVGAPGSIAYCAEGRVSYMVSSGFLWCKLPTGRLIAYFKPSLKYEIEKVYRDARSGETLEPHDFAPDLLAALVSAGVIAVEEGKRRHKVVYWGTSSKAGKAKVWGPRSLYGGHQDENIVQGACRDILYEGAERIEARGVPIVIHVHDELVAEILDGPTAMKAEEFAALMSMDIEGHEGLPLSAKGWEGARYDL